MGKPIGKSERHAYLYGHKLCCVAILKIHGTVLMQSKGSRKIM